MDKNQKSFSVNISELPTPYNDECEKALLGCFFSAPQIVDEAMGKIKPKDFFNPVHQMICQGIFEIRKSGADPDPMLLIQWLDRNEMLEVCGGVSYSGNLVLAANQLSFSFYLKTIKRLSNLRILQKHCTDTLSDIMQNEDDDMAVLTRAGERFSIVEDRTTISKVQTAFQVGKDFLRDVVEAIKRRREGRNISDIQIGIPSIDYATGGCLPGEMIVVAARSGEGKSVVGVHVKRVNGRNKQEVGVVNLEMIPSKYFARAVAAESGIDSADIRDGRLTEDEMSRVDAWETEISKWPIFYETVSHMSSAQFRASARRLVSKHGVKVIILDYLQLMTDDEENGTREQEVAKISRTVKQTALELNIPIVVLAQLNRQATGEPTIHHLRESGAITQDADKIILLHRHDVTNECISNDEYPTKVILGKQRDGRIGAEEYILEGKFCRLKPAPRTSK